MAVQLSPGANALKTAEGAAAMFVGVMREEFSRGPISKLRALFAMPVLKRFRGRVVESLLRIRDYDSSPP